MADGAHRNDGRNHGGPAAPRLWRATAVSGIVLGAASVFWYSSQGVTPAPAPAPERLLAEGNAPEPAAATVDPRGSEVLRTPALVVSGTVRGRVVGPDDAPIDGATVSLGTNELEAPMVTATTGADGDFCLGAPAGPLTLRLGAAGFAEVQLGGLAPERVAPQDLDLGTLRLRAAVTYCGQVRANGRGVADADVALRPVVGPPDLPIAVVQRVRSDDSGWFHFAQAFPAPICLCVEATGYWSVTRRLENESTTLQVDLDAVPRVQGRVIDAETGAPLAGAKVQIVGRDRVTIHQSLAHPLETQAQADGTFGLEVRFLREFFVAASAEGRLTLRQGPFASKAVPTSLVMPLERGCVVVAAVTWRGQGVRAQAGLRPRENSGENSVVAEAAEGEVLRLPAVRPGRWLLGIRGDNTAEHGVWLDLLAPGEHRVNIALADGACLVGSVLGQHDPDSVVVVEQVDGDRDSFVAPGMTRSPQRLGAVRSDGSFEVTGLSAGRWRAFVFLRGKELSTATGRQLASRFMIGETFELAAGEQQLRLDLPSVSRTVGRLRGRCGTRSVGASVRLLPTDATQKIGWPVRPTTVGGDGTFVLDPVPPGNWRVEVRLGAASPRVQAVTIAAGAETTCVFPD